MNGKQKTATAAGGVGLTGVLLWLAQVAGIDIPPDVAGGIAAVLGWIIRDVTN